MRCLFNLIFTATLHIFSLNTFAQSSIKPEPSSSFTQTYFQNELKEDAHLYTGKEYYRYTAGVKGYPFYITDQMQPGEILYDGTIYKDVPMLFDAVRQVVVINQYQQDNRIQLLTEKINYFILNGHRFETFLQAEGTENAVSRCVIV